MSVEELSQLIYKLDILTEAKVGRIPHFEDHLIDGTDNAINALQQLKSQLGQGSIKWDGQSAIYFGHDKQGNFYLVPKSQWLRGQLLDKQGLTNDILSTGKKSPKQTDAEFLQTRKNLANTYMKLWDSFENASKNTKGFFKGDLMFDQRQKPNADGNYRFTPSKVTYTVSPKGLYGKMPSANAFVTIHGKAKKLGSEDHVPVNPKEIESLNSTPYVIALGPQYTTNAKLDTKQIDTLINYLQKNKNSLDGIINYVAPKFSTIKNVLYDYGVKSRKSGNNLTLDQYLATSNLSANQQSLIKQLSASKEFKIFMDTYSSLRNVNQSTLSQLTKQHANNISKQLGITASVGNEPGGEGYVIPGAGKFINPAWSKAAPNPKFT